MINIEKYMYVVDEVVWRYCVNHKDWIDDAKGEGNIALWEAIQSWKPDDRVYAKDKDSFEAWARVCIRNAILNFIQKEEIRKIVIPVENIENMGQINKETPLSLLIQKEGNNQAWKILENLLGKLNDREKYILHNHIMSDDPMTMVMIADIWKCDEASIRRDKKRILKSLETKDET